MDPLKIAENEKKYVIHSWMAQKDFKPFIVTGGKGAVIWDETGKKYLDFSSQLFNRVVSHSIAYEYNELHLLPPVFIPQSKIRIPQLL